MGIGIVGKSKNNNNNPIRVEKSESNLSSQIRLPKLLTPQKSFIAYLSVIIYSNLRFFYTLNLDKQYWIKPEML